MYIRSNVKNTSALPIYDDVLGWDIKNTFTFNRWDALGSIG
jgi:hypothetical protein